MCSYIHMYTHTGGPANTHVQAHKCTHTHTHTYNNNNNNNKFSISDDLDCLFKDDNYFKIHCRSLVTEAAGID